MTGTVAIQRAVLDSDLPAPASLVMLTLLVRADFTTAVVPEEFGPSLTELAKMTRLGRSTVARMLNVLESCGWVERDRPAVAAARSEGARTGYRLMIGGSPAAGLVPERDHVDQDDTDTGSPAAGPAVVPERDQGSPAAGPINRKTPTGSTSTTSSRTSHSQPARETRAKADRGTRLSDDFAATPAMIAWARTNTPLVGARETDAFIDYWRAQPGAKGRKVDWDATWRNWMRRAQTDAERRLPLAARASPQQPGNVIALRADPRPSTTDQRVAQALALAAKYDAMEASHDHTG